STTSSSTWAPSAGHDKLKRPPRTTSPSAWSACQRAMPAGCPQAAHKVSGAASMLLRTSIERVIKLKAALARRGSGGSTRDCRDRRNLRAGGGELDFSLFYSGGVTRHAGGVHGRGL